MDNYKVVLVDDEVEVIDAIEQRIHWDILGFEVRQTAGKLWSLWRSSSRMS